MLSNFHAKRKKKYPSLTQSPGNALHQPSLIQVNNSIEWLIKVVPVIIIPNRLRERHKWKKKKRKKKKLQNNHFSIIFFFSNVTLLQNKIATTDIHKEFFKKFLPKKKKIFYFDRPRKERMIRKRLIMSMYNCKAPKIYSSGLSSIFFPPMIVCVSNTRN